MGKKWVLDEDMHLALFYEVAGAFCMSMDLGRPEKSCTQRYKKLEETGAANSLRRIKALEYRCLLDYFSALQDAKGVENMMFHVGADIEAMSGEFASSGIGEERAKRHMLQDCIDLGEVPADMTYEKINRLYPDFWDTRKLTPRLSVVK